MCNISFIRLPLYVTRLLGRRASRRPGMPIEQKMDAFRRPNSGGKGKVIFNDFPKFNISETK